MMRIQGGRLRGRMIHSSSDPGLRPTIARLKSCYFNIVRDRLTGARFFDACAGAGAMGVEALSQGAALAVFAEKSPVSLSALKKNLSTLGLDDATVLGGDLFREIQEMGRRRVTFDLVYFDPPYFKGMYEKFFRLAGKWRLLAPGGLLAANHFKKVDIPEECGGLKRVRSVRQGDSVLSFYEWGEPPRGTPTTGDPPNDLSEPENGNMPGLTP